VSGERAPCPNCTRPKATAKDDALYHYRAHLYDEGLPTPMVPPEWGGDDGPLLCWRDAAGDDGDCNRPEWFAGVTPLEVMRLREDAKRWRTLMALGRIRVLGHSHLGQPDAHLGMELWGVYPGPVGHQEEARAVLASFVDGVERA
jgi:hypothetical protein